MLKGPGKKFEIAGVDCSFSNLLVTETENCMKFILRKKPRQKKEKPEGLI